MGPDLLDVPRHGQQADAGGWALPAPFGVLSLVCWECITYHVGTMVPPGVSFKSPSLRFSFTISS